MENDIKLCLNCGNHQHEYKNCCEPLTSWGIIAVKIENNKKERINIIHDKTIENNTTGIIINTLNDLNNMNKYMNNIYFLMVSRKHSLGYVEFLRGRYKPGNVSGITSMFEQMTKEEIEKIGEKKFDELWEEFWMSETMKNEMIKEYNKSKMLYEQLKNKKGVELGLDFYINNIKPKYKNPEWGFPKGRKCKGETDIECAKREFV